MAALDAPRRRRVFVADEVELGRLTRPLVSWIDRLGYELVEPSDRGQADLWVCSAEVPPTEPPPVKWIAVSPRRLDPIREAELRDSGAACVLDAHQCLLDLAYALAEHLFQQRSEQRRHGLTHGRLEVGVRGEGGSPAGSGRLVGLNRCGAWIEAPSIELTCGAVVELAIGVEERPARLNGRVVCDGNSFPDGARLLAIELALDQGTELQNFRGLARAGLRPAAPPVEAPVPV